jgi:hypothetical protein
MAEVDATIEYASRSAQVRVEARVFGNSKHIIAAHVDPQGIDLKAPLHVVSKGIPDLKRF